MVVAAAETEAVVASARALSQDARNMLTELKLGQDACVVVFYSLLAFFCVSDCIYISINYCVSFIPMNLTTIFLL